MQDWKSVGALVAAVGVGIWVATIEARLTKAEKGVDVTKVAEALVKNHSDALRGDDGIAPSVDEVKAALLNDSIAVEALTGRRGKDGISPTVAEIRTAFLDEPTAVAVLKGERGPEGNPAKFPAGAIVAFDLPNGCPPGWENMGEKWKGRMLVAAVENSNDTYGFRRTGGRVDIPNAGAHDHSGRSKGMDDHGPRNPHGHARDSGSNQNHTHAFTTSTAPMHSHGGNNMPPSSRSISARRRRDDRSRCPALSS